MPYLWVPPAATKGRLLVADGTTWQPLTVGSDGQVLEADSAQPTGVKWGTPASGSGFRGARAYHNTTQSISTGTPTAVALNSELYDTNTLHDNSTNNSRLSLDQEGFWRVIGQVSWATNTSGRRTLRIDRNGSTTDTIVTLPPASGANTYMQVDVDVEVTSSSDYVELIAVQDSGSSINLAGGSSATWLAAHYLGA